MANFNLIRAIKKAYPDATNKEISQSVGYSESTVSRWYYNKAQIPEEVVTTLSKKFPLNPVKPKKFKGEVEKVDLTEAAKRLGLSKEGLMMCLQQDKFPFGFSYLPRYGNKHNYVIFRGAFERFLNKEKEYRVELEDISSKALIDSKDKSINKYLKENKQNQLNQWLKDAEEYYSKS